MEPDVIGDETSARTTRRTKSLAVIGGAAILVIAAGVVVVASRGGTPPLLTPTAALQRAMADATAAGSLRYTTQETLAYGGGSSQVPITDRSTVSIDTTLDPRHHNAESVTRTHEVTSNSTNDLTQDVRIIGNTSYDMLASPDEPSRARPWLSDVTATNPPVDGEIGSADPAQALAPLTGLTGLTDLGTVELAGVRARHLHGIAPIGSSAAAFGLSLRLLGTVDSATAIDNSTTATVDLYLDRSDRLVRIHESTRLVSSSLTHIYADFEATTDFCCFGQPVTVEKPPAAQTETGDDFIKQLESSPPTP